MGINEGNRPRVAEQDPLALPAPELAGILLERTQVRRGIPVTGTAHLVAPEAPLIAVAQRLITATQSSIADDQLAQVALQVNAAYELIEKRPAPTEEEEPITPLVPKEDPRAFDCRVVHVVYNYVEALVSRRNPNTGKGNTWSPTPSADLTQSTIIHGERILKRIGF